METDETKGCRTESGAAEVRIGGRLNGAPESKALVGGALPLVVVQPENLLQVGRSAYEANDTLLGRIAHLERENAALRRYRRNAGPSMRNMQRAIDVKQRTMDYAVRDGRKSRDEAERLRKDYNAVCARNANLAVENERLRTAAGDHVRSARRDLGLTPMGMSVRQEWIERVVIGSLLIATVVASWTIGFRK